MAVLDPMGLVKTSLALVPEKVLSSAVSSLIPLFLQCHKTQVHTHIQALIPPPWSSELSDKLSYFSSLFFSVLLTISLAPKQIH